MRRRQVGVGAIKKDKAAAEKFKAKTAELQENSLQAMTSQMETFRQKLEEFARTHKQEIKKDPEFRRHFQVTKNVNRKQNARLLVGPTRKSP